MNPEPRLYEIEALYDVGLNARYDGYNISLVNSIENIIVPSFLANPSDLLEEHIRKKTGHHHLMKRQINIYAKLHG